MSEREDRPLNPFTTALGLGGFIVMIAGMTVTANSDGDVFGGPDITELVAGWSLIGFGAWSMLACLVVCALRWQPGPSRPESSGDADPGRRVKVTERLGLSRPEKGATE